MKKVLWGALAALVVACLAPVAPAHSSPPVADAPFLVAAAPSVEAQYVSNYDGDTVTVRLDGGKIEKIRLLGVDTAEMAQGEWGAKAKAFTQRLTAGKRLRIEFDVQQRDKYGRLLGYVYTPDGTFVNLELIKQGYAMLLTYAPNVAHVDQLTAAQTQARAQGLGIWSSANGLKQSPHAFRHRGDNKPAVTRGEGMHVARPQARSAANPAAARSTAAAGKVSLNRRSLKYHEPGCRYYTCANCEEVSGRDAQARGGVPCKVCH